MTRSEKRQRYASYVNPGFVDLLETLDYGRDFVRAEGTCLWDEQGNEYTDFLAGFGVHNIGHNHPRLLGALSEALASGAPSMLNIDAPACQSALAERLCRITHPELCRAFFANSGAEAVEMAIKTARAATGRSLVVACRNAYHGLTTGALALTDAPLWQKPFGPLSAPVGRIPFNDLEALRQICQQEKPAALIVEPVQGEGGINSPATAYLAEAAALLKRCGALLIVDEIQTGLGRTGEMFATPFGQIVPDMLLLGKAVSGGIAPLALGLVRSAVWDRAYAGPDRSTLNASTFAGGHLACTAGMTVLDILEQEQLVERSAQTGACLLPALRQLAGRHPAIREVRGRGLLIGVELEPATGLMMRAVPAWARDGLQAHVICALLLRDYGIIAQPCSLRQNVMRIEPPLTMGAEEAGRFVATLDQVLAACPSPNAALKLAFRKQVLGGAL